MLKQRKPLAVDTIFVLAMICVFAASSLMVVLYGARVYKNIMADTDNNYHTRTGLSYVTNKIRSADVSGSVYTIKRDGVDMLVISEHLEGTEYLHCIYYYDGWLREIMFVEAGYSFNLRDGERIVSAEDFTVRELGAGFLLLTLKNNGGNVLSMAVSLRS